MIRKPTRLIVPAAALFLLLGCGSSAGSGASSTPATSARAAAPGGDATAPSEAVATEDGGATVSDDGSNPNGPIGGDIGDRSKGSIQAQISGGLTASVDLPYAPVLARLLLDGPRTAYLPFTDPAQGTVFLTITDSGLLVQYAGPDQVGITNGGTPCQLHLDSLDATGAKGSFTCTGMLLVRNDGMGAVDMSATFEGHQ